MSTDRHRCHLMPIGAHCKANWKWHAGVMPESHDDDVKKKFREALERKKGKNAASDHPDDTPQTGPEQGHEQKAKAQRMYRRKAV